MKSFIILLAFLGLSSIQLQSQNTNDRTREGLAIAAFRQACDYTGAVNAETEMVSICFASGYVSQVLITVKCQANDCLTARYAPLARVYFGCNGGVTYVECLRN
jgi:hypothetical protein